MSLPQVRVRHGWLLVENASIGLNELWGEGRPLLSPKEYTRIAENYEAIWRPYEEPVLRGMCDLLGLEFRQNTIDVYIAPWFRAFSDPMVIGVTYQPDRFVEVLSHELIHRLLTDNKQSDYKTEYRYRWESLFGSDHSFGTVVHIPVHAVYQGIFDDIIDEPQRTINDIDFVNQDHDYRKAWEYVKEHGHKKIINQLKEDYKELMI